MPIGLICLEWSLLEMLMSLYYVALVCGKTVVSGDATHLAIIDSFEALPTWQTKCKLMRSAASHRLDAKDAAALSKLLASIDPIQERRNHAVHGRWFVSKDDKNRFVRRKGIIGPAFEWSPEVFRQLSADIRSARSRLGEFFDNVAERLERNPYERSLAAALREFTPQQGQETIES